MPGTANERGLLDPFNPVQALPKSAEFLPELRDQFGNLGRWPPPIMLARAGFRSGSPAPGGCRRRRAATSRHHGLHRRGVGERAEGRQDTGADTDVDAVN